MSFTRTLAFAAVIATGCSGGNDDEKIYELTTGTYATSDFDLDLDDCALEIDTSAIPPVTVDGATISLGPIMLTRDGNALEASGAIEVGVSPQDCLLDFAFAIDGSVTGTDELELSEDIVETVKAGTECGDVGPVFPCTTRYSFRASK